MPILFYLANFLRTSKGFIWRGKGGGRIYRRFCNKKRHQNTNRLPLIKGSQICKLRNLSIFWYMGRCMSQAYWNHSFRMQLSYLEKYPLSSHPESPLHTQLMVGGLASVAEGLMEGIFCPPEFLLSWPLRSSYNVMPGWLLIICLMIWQATVFICNSQYMN